MRILIEYLLKLRRFWGRKHEKDATIKKYLIVQNEKVATELYEEATIRILDNSN